jgi:hypothetical protein
MAYPGAEWAPGGYADVSPGPVSGNGGWSPHPNFGAASHHWVVIPPSGSSGAKPSSLPVAGSMRAAYHAVCRGD